jgi:hypothetical protein
MLALTDVGLAYLMLAASRVSPKKRSRWLREIATKLDPPNRATTSRGSVCTLAREIPQ